MKNIAELAEDGAFALFFRPHPEGFDSSRVPTPENLPSKAKKNANARGSARVGGLGAGGMDWCIMHRNVKYKNVQQSFNPGLQANRPTWKNNLFQVNQEPGLRW